MPRGEYRVGPNTWSETRKGSGMLVASLRDFYESQSLRAVEKEEMRFQVARLRRKEDWWHKYNISNK